MIVVQFHGLPKRFNEFHSAHLMSWLNLQKTSLINRVTDGTLEIAELPNPFCHLGQDKLVDYLRQINFEVLSQPGANKSIDQPYILIFSASPLAYQFLVKVIRNEFGIDETIHWIEIEKEAIK